MTGDAPGPDATVPPPGGGRLRSRVSAADSYGLVVLLIIVTYVVSVSVQAEWGASLVVIVQIATVWFALRTSRARRAARLVADVLLVLAFVVAMLAPLLNASRDTSTFVLAASAVLYLIAPLAIVRNLMGRSHVDGETFLGTIAAYLLIGMFFAFTYRLTGQLQDANFFGSAGDGTTAQTLFFSFTTLTTTGYGNLVPAGNPGQSMAVGEMLLGQLFLATAIAKVITAWKPKRQVEAEEAREG
jgi:Ion channel